MTAFLTFLFFSLKYMFIFAVVPLGLICHTVCKLSFFVILKPKISFDLMLKI